MELSKSVASVILTGSYTKLKRTGNEGNVWWVGSGVALNSLGMPNGGEEYLKDTLRLMVQVAHDAGKSLIVNVAGFNAGEYAELTETALEHGADGVELNLGCPNVVTGDNERKPIPSYSEDVFAEILETVSLVCDDTTVIWIKVSPNPMGDMIKRLAARVARHKCVKAVTAINTFPNCYALGPGGKPRITVGLAGMSGAALKTVGLGQVLQWRQALPLRTKVIGVGGIRTGQDIDDYAKVGADAFQVTTELLKSGTLDAHVLGTMVREYDELAA